MPKRPQKKPSNPPEQPIPADHPDAIPEPGDIGLQAIATLDKHKKTVITATLVAAIAICAFLVIRQIQEQKQLAAASAFSQAASERSIEKLDAVVSDYSGSNAAGNALLTKSEIQLSLDKPEDAKIALLSFVDQFKRHPRYVHGLFGLGNLHQDAGDSAKALDYYEQALAAGPDADIAPMVVIRQGDLALEESDRLLKEGKAEEAQAKKDEARAFYEDSYQRMNLRANRFVMLAREKIELLAIGDVPVVAAPPPPPAPEPVKPKAGTGTVLSPPGAATPAAPKPKTDKPEPKKPDTPKPDTPKPDAPKPDAPKPDAPKPDAPKPDAPKPDAPKPDAPKPDAPKPDAPKPDAPKPAADSKTEKPAAPKPPKPKAKGEKKAASSPAPTPAPKPPAPKPE